MSLSARVEVGGDETDTITDEFLDGSVDPMQPCHFAIVFHPGRVVGVFFLFLFFLFSFDLKGKCQPQLSALSAAQRALGRRARSSGERCTGENRAPP